MDGGIPISALVPTRTGEYHVEQPQGQFYLLYECVEGRQHAGEQFNNAKILETGYFVASAHMVLADAPLRGQPIPQNHRCSRVRARGLDGGAGARSTAKTDPDPGNEPTFQGKGVSFTILR